MPSTDRQTSSLDEVLSIARNAGYKVLTPLQKKVLDSGDGVTLINSQGERGSVGALLLSTMFSLKQRPGSRCIILLPTPRDIPKIEGIAAKLISHSRLEHIVASLGSGDDVREENKKLERRPDIIIGTFRRIIELTRGGKLPQEEVSTVGVYFSRNHAKREELAEAEATLSKLKRVARLTVIAPGAEVISSMGGIVPPSLGKPNCIGVTNLQKGVDTTKMQPKGNKNEVKGAYPSMDERVSRFLSELTDDIRNREDAKQLEEYKKRIRKGVPLTLRSYVAAYLLKRAMEASPGKNPIGGSKSEKFVSLFIGVGRRQGVKIPTIVEQLCALQGIEKKDIGIIRIFAGYSFVEVRSDKSEQVIREMKSKTIRGKKVVVEYARER